MLAWDYPVLTFTTKDGVEQSVAVDGLEIKFVDGKMMAVNSEGTLTIDVAMLSKMAFAKQTTVIDKVTDDEGEDIWTSVDVPVEVFSLTGASLGYYFSKQQACEQLSAGIYLIKVKGRTLKVLLK